MRTFALRALAAGVAVILAYPVVAQFQPGGRGGFGGGFGKALLLNKSVQDELKLTDDQKAELQKVQEKQRAAFEKAKEGGKEKGGEAFRAAMEETAKELDKWKETGLKPEQAKRLKQIELQTQGVRAFADADVQKGLNLSEKQTAEIKEITDGFDKDVRDLRNSASGGGGGRGKMFEKVQGLQKEAMEKAAGVLNDAQKAKWKEMVGDKFEIQMQQGGFGRGKGKNKQKQDE